MNTREIPYIQNAPKYTVGCDKNTILKDLTLEHLQWNSNYTYTIPAGTYVYPVTTSILPDMDCNRWYAPVKTKWEFVFFSYNAFVHSDTHAFIRLDDEFVLGFFVNINNIQKT